MKPSIDMNRVCLLVFLAVVLVLAVSNRYRVEMPWMTFEPAKEAVTPND
jgi:hypothetical protein